jgi:hypothetical protein
VTFWTASECSVFVNKMAEKESPTVVIGDAGQEGVSMSVRIKHDEPLWKRRRKQLITKTWEIIQELYKAAHGLKPAKQLRLSVDHYNCTISAEMDDMVLRRIVKINHVEGARSTLEISKYLKCIAGFSEESANAIITKVNEVAGQ